MPIYRDKQTNRLYIKFEYKAKTYKKRFRDCFDEDYVKEYEAQWRKTLAEKDMEFVKEQVRSSDKDVFGWIVKLEQHAKSVKAIKSKGLVYILKFSDAYKIGFTTNLKRRLHEFTKIALPYEPELLMTINTNYPQHLERMLHKRFEKKRLKGEWFSLESTDLMFIEKLKAAFILQS